MKKISYYLDYSLLAEAHISKDYSKIKNYLLNSRSSLDCTVETKEALFGVYFHLNRPLTKLYGFDVYMVDFAFSDIERLHDLEQEKALGRMFKEFFKRIFSVKAYFVIRIPSHIVDVLKVFNKFAENFYFCGGTVSYVSGEEILRSKAEMKREDIRIISADESYIYEHKEELKNISMQSFGNYQGQYHLSPILSDKAHLIYTEWLERAFEVGNGEKLFVADCRGKVVGFWSYKNDEYAQHTSLTAVSPNYRNYGIYKSLMKKAIEMAAEDGKHMILGTQFDNFTVQHTCSSMGLSPYLSFYNIHIDGRR